LATAALFDSICPRKMVRNTDNEDDSGDLKLKPFKRTANLRWIKYDIPEPVFLRLLLCKEGKRASDPEFCPYPEYKNDSADKKICESKGRLAHIYFGYEQPERIPTEMQSCIVIFSKNSSDTDELIQKLKTTVTQLGIGKEKFYFYVVPFHYEKDPINSLNRHKLKKDFKNQYAGSKIKIEDRIQMNEKNDSMTLKIGHDKEADEFLFTPTVEKEEP